MVILYVLISIIAAIFIPLLNRKSIKGSDHFLHVNIIDRIKVNNHSFLKDYIITYGEKNPFYPQLFHWVLSFFKRSFYNQNSFRINLVIKILEVLIFNVFILQYQKISGFEDIYILYANLIFSFFPLSYVTWNAKNTGLSARGIGIVLGQLFCYLLFFYYLNDSLIIYAALIILFFLIILSSQITTQFVLLSLISLPFLFSKYELLLIPLISFALFGLLMPIVAKGYFKGQYNHKRNFALYNAKIYLWKNRPSIYRDFVYDFWIKLKKDFFKGLVYIFYNPLIEIIYGVPYLYFLFYNHIYVNELRENYFILLSLVVSSLLCFLLTSFKYTRFLGEPQRYLEFSLPFVAILTVINLEIKLVLVLFSFCLVMIFLSNFIYNFYKKKTPKFNAFTKLSSKVKNNIDYKGKICISNDNEAMKYLFELGMLTIKTDTSSYFKNAEDYYKLLYNSSTLINSPYAVDLYNNQFQADYLVINKNFYDLDLLKKYSIFNEVKELFSVENFTLYALEKAKYAEKTK